MILSQTKPIRPARPLLSVLSNNSPPRLGAGFHSTHPPENLETRRTWDGLQGKAMDHLLSCKPLNEDKMKNTVRRTECNRCPEMGKQAAAGCYWRLPIGHWLPLSPPPRLFQGRISRSRPRPSGYWH